MDTRNEEASKRADSEGADQVWRKTTHGYVLQMPTSFTNSAPSVGVPNSAPSRRRHTVALDARKTDHAVAPSISAPAASNLSSPKTVSDLGRSEDEALPNNAEDATPKASKPRSTGFYLGPGGYGRVLKSTIEMLQSFEQDMCEAAESSVKHHQSIAESYRSLAKGHEALARHHESVIEQRKQKSTRMEELIGQLKALLEARTPSGLSWEGK